MITLLLTKQIIQLFLIMFLGFMIVRMNLLKSTDSKTLSVLTVYIITPCTILNAFQIEYTPEIAKNFLLAIGSAIIIHILLYVLQRVLDPILHLKNVEKASLMFSNAGNLIIPLVTAILGEEWVIYASAFMVVQLFILWTYGKSLMEGKRSMDLKSILKNINLITCVIGLALFIFHIQLPEVIRGTVKSLGSAIGPVAMLMLGMVLAGVDIKSMVKGKRIWVISFVKMIVSPLIVLLIMKYSGLSALSAEGATILFISLMATMTPSATTITQMALLYGQEVDYASGINTITTLMCIVTMPLMAMIYYL